MFEHTITVVELMLIVILYMLPTILAYARDIPARRTVTVINIVLGWTLIVWIIAFLWALSAETEADEFA
jgi:Superinfection immunity protein